MLSASKEATIKIVACLVLSKCSNLNKLLNGPPRDHVIMPKKWRLTKNARKINYSLLPRASFGSFHPWYRECLRRRTQTADDPQMASSPL